MKKSNITQGRVNQKLQTRADILKAAKSLMQKKKKLSLDDVAKKANISRATMYRYFSNIDLLVTEASLDVQHDSTDTLLDAVKEMTIENKIFYIQNYYNELAQKNEIVFRRYISAVLTESIVSKKQLRGARRLDSLNNALEPYKKTLGKDTFKKLVSVSAVLMGIDSLIICKDVCKLNNAETNETLKWALDMMLKGVLSN